MKFRIHSTVPTYNEQDYEDSVVVEGETIDDVRERANAEVTRRGGVDPWSEELR